MVVTTRADVTMPGVPATSDSVGSAAADAVVANSCPNCGAELADTYCARCGQKKPLGDLSLREFLAETTNELTHWEGKVPQTLKTLLLKPGLLTLDFLAGRRARWLAPLRIYLICSIAFFLTRPIVERVTHESAREVARLTITNPDGSTTLTAEGRRALDEGLPARVFGRERLERAAANSGRLNKAVDAALPKAIFVLLPVFALFTRLAWRRRLPRYPAHLYAALHLHATWFATLALAMVTSAFIVSRALDTTIGILALAYILGYTLVAMRRVFGDSWLKTIGKGAIIAVAYGASLFAASLLLLGYALLTM